MREYQVAPVTEIGVNTPPDQRRELGVRTFDIQNAKGEVVCRVQGTFSLFDNPSREMRALLVKEKLDQVLFYRVEDLTFLSPDGTLVSLSEVCPVGDIPIYIAAERLGNYCFAGDEATGEQGIFSPSPDTAVGIGVLLHELGHADQSREKPYLALRQTEEQKKRSTVRLPLASYQFDSLYRRLNETPGAFTSDLLSPADRDLMAKLIDRRNAAAERETLIDIEMGGTHAAVESEQWDFVLQHLTNEQDGGVIPSTVERFFYDTDDDGSSTIPVRDPFVESEQKEELFARALPVLLGMRRRLSAGADLNSGGTSISVRWSPEDRAVIADCGLENTGDREWIHFTLRLADTADEAAFQDLTRRIRAILGEIEKKKEIKDVEIAQEQELIRQEMQTFLNDHGQAIQDELARPRRLLERDATRRALVWMRTLKHKHGIDLLQDMKDEDLLGFGTDKGVLEGVTTDVVGDLNRALETYGAESSHMRKGKMRSPALKNKPKTT